MTRACVIGDMDLVRALGIAGISSIVAGPNTSETRWSRYVEGTIDLPNLWSRPERAVEALVAAGRHHLEKPVLVYQKDPAVLAISRYRDVLGDWYRFVIPDGDVVEDLVDKRRFHERGQELGLPVLWSAFARPGLDPVPTDMAAWPVAVKPVLRDRSRTTWAPVAHGGKAIVCNGPEDLYSLWHSPALRGVWLVVQRYIPGDASRIVSYHSYVDTDGSILAEFSGRKIRTLPAETGQSTAVRITQEADVMELGRHVLRSFGFCGVAKVDMKQAPDGSLHLLEVNPRFSLWHHPGAVAGVNIPAAVVRRLTEGPIDPLGPARPEVTWVQVWGDWRARRLSEVSALSWFRFVRHAGARRAFHASDPGATFGALARGALQATGRIPHQ